MSYVTGLRCLSCGKPVGENPFRYLCPDCGGFLDVEYDFDRLRTEVSPSVFDQRHGPVLEQWLEFLPIERPELISAVTLGETTTPMLPAARLPGADSGVQIWLKNEALSPTCSLKDRSISMVVLKALELGRSSVGIVSSGNAAASLAAYAARAGLRAVVFVTQEAPLSKLSKTGLYGPLALQLRGGYEDAERLFQEIRDELSIFDCNGLVNPYRAEGKKTFAFEAARALKWKAPGAVFVPSGYGTGLVSAWKGFKELYRLGFIDSLPAMVAVQPACCAPVVRAFEAGLQRIRAVPETRSIAEAVCLGNPQMGGQRMLDVVRESHGLAVGVTEDEIREAVHLLAEKEGIASEPAGAVGLAGALNVIRRGHPWSNMPVVVSVTGHAVNDTAAAAQMSAPPVSVQADLKSILKVLHERMG